MVAGTWSAPLRRSLDPRLTVLSSAPRRRAAEARRLLSAGSPAATQRHEKGEYRGLAELGWFRRSRHQPARRGCPDARTAAGSRAGAGLYVTRSGSVVGPLPDVDLCTRSCGLGAKQIPVDRGCQAIMGHRWRARSADVACAIRTFEVSRFLAIVAGEVRGAEGVGRISATTRAWRSTTPWHG